MRALRWQKGGHQGDRHQARREDVRDTADEGGVRQGRGHGQLLPRPSRQPQPELRQVLHRGRHGARADRRVQLGQHAQARPRRDEGKDRLSGVHPERAEGTGEHSEMRASRWGKTQ